MSICTADYSFQKSSWNVIDESLLIFKISAWRLLTPDLMKSTSICKFAFNRWHLQALDWVISTSVYGTIYVDRGQCV